MEVKRLLKPMINYFWEIFGKIRHCELQSKRRIASNNGYSEGNTTYNHNEELIAKNCTIINTHKLKNEGKEDLLISKYHLMIVGLNFSVNANENFGLWKHENWIKIGIDAFADLLKFCCNGHTKVENI